MAFFLGLSFMISGLQGGRGGQEKEEEERRGEEREKVEGKRREKRTERDVNHKKKKKVLSFPFLSLFPHLSFMAPSPLPYTSKSRAV